MSTDFAKTLYVRTTDDYCTARDDDIVAAAMDIIERRFQRGVTLNSPRLVRNYLSLKFEHQSYESFVVILLDTRLQLLEAHELFRGTIDGVAVYCREVAKLALLMDAEAVIVAHNHPSGCADPSRADQAITQELKRALWILKIRLLDHLIVAGTDVYSFSDQGLL